jgi:hypothetical protein
MEKVVGNGGTEDRMDVIRLKEMLGGTLTDQELMCLQIEQNGFGCVACAGVARAAAIETQDEPGGPEQIA